MMRMICAAAFLAVLPLAAHAAANTACPLTAGEQQVAFPGDVPAPVMAQFNREFAPYALPGQPFQATDVIRPGPRLPGRRVIFARRLGPRWVIAFEQGGEEHSWREIAYQTSADGRSAWRMVLNVADPGDLCAPVERMLRGNPAVPAGFGRR